MRVNFVLSTVILFLLLNLCHTAQKKTAVKDKTKSLKSQQKLNSSLRRWLHENFGNKIFEDAEFHPEKGALGKGKCGEVLLAEILPVFKKEYGADHVAIKRITNRNANTNEKFIKREILSQSLCKSPFIVKLYGVYVNKSHVNLLLEYVHNNQLGIVDRDIAKNKGKRSPEFGQHQNDFPMYGIKEDLARFYIAQLLLAVDHLHSKGYSNNDLWIENILVDDKGFIKLSDFGWAFPFEEIKEGDTSKEDTDDVNHPFRGWFYYRAPERINVFSRKDENIENDTDKNFKGQIYDKTSDMWTVGCVLYTMVTGTFPFVEPRAERKIHDGKYEMPYINHCSEDLKKLFQKIFVVDPKQRLGAKGLKDFKEHVWFKEFDWNSLKKREAKAFRAFLPKEDENFREFLKKHSNEKPKAIQQAESKKKIEDSNSPQNKQKILPQAQLQKKKAEDIVKKRFEKIVLNLQNSCKEESSKWQKEKHIELISAA